MKRALERGKSVRSSLSSQLSVAEMGGSFGPMPPIAHMHKASAQKEESASAATHLALVRRSSDVKS